MKQLILFLIPITLIFSSCGDSSNASNSMLPTNADSRSAKKESNAITKSMPSVMVVPSDAMLKRMDCLKETNNQGVTSYSRDYAKSFIQDSELKFVIAEIESQFSNKGFSLENMEQTLKMLNNNNAMDEMEGIARDLRAELMNTAKPDYVIELDYELKQDPKSRNINKTLTYIVKCMDVYTNKSVASITRANIGKTSENNDVPGLVKEDFSNSIGELSTGITSHFKDLLANGIEITLRLAVLNSSAVALDDDCGDEEIGERVVTWLKENTVNSTYKMAKNTETEMFFTNVRIFTQDESGNSYSAYDFAKDLKKGLKKGCGLSVSNKTQSLGDAFIQVK
ncbi:MAG: nucleoside diphosphate kinase [Chitinophagales bacterium]|jgi:nucleoside diphosphate kinase|tara:strand:- start:11689 stop:12702 length:1014 start_codon:yes stop_codon:yes gene_type:complete